MANSREHSGISVPARPMRVAGAVPALVVGRDDLADDRGEAGVGDDPGADLGVGVHHPALVVVEGAGLLQHRVRDADLADVVQQEAEGDLRVLRELRVHDRAQRQARGR